MIIVVGQFIGVVYFFIIFAIFFFFTFRANLNKSSHDVDQTALIMIQGYGPVTQALLGTLLTWGLTALGSAMVVFLRGNQVNHF